MTVAVVLLSTGQEVIVKLKEESEDGYLIVSAPHQIHTQFDPNVGFRFGFTPFMVYALGGEVKIPLQAVAAIAIPDNGIESEYLRRTDPTAIITPPEKKIITT
jgi:hypothetical protein